MFNRLIDWIVKMLNPELYKKPEPCDHVFFPETHPDDDKRLIGQRCAICCHFNHVDDIIPGYTATYLRKHDHQSQA